MQQLTRDEVISVVGDLDDHVIAEVIATGADQQELELAVERLRDDIYPDRDILDPHVVALYDVLAPILTPREEEEIYATD